MLYEVITWRVNNNWNIFGSLGLLKTTVNGEAYAYDGYEIILVDGREQAHAPNYQFSIGAQYRSDNGFYARISTRGMDSFYFDNVNDEQSKAYTVTDARIGYEQDNWEA